MSDSRTGVLSATSPFAIGVELVKKIFVPNAIASRTIVSPMNVVAQIAYVSLFTATNN